MIKLKDTGYNYFSFNTGEYHVEHLEIKRKDKGQLPITKTGYKSHFMTHPDVINDYGGVENYVRAWLNEDAQSQSWKKYIEDCKQLTLF